MIEAEPIKMLQYVMEHENIKMIKGNHEDMMFDCLIPPYLPPEEREDLKYDPNIRSNRNLWIQYNGGGITAKKYNKLTFKEQKQIYYFLKELPLYEVVEAAGIKYLLLHGAPPEMDHIDMENFDPGSQVLWDRIERHQLDADLVPGYQVIVGHTPTVYYGCDGKIIEGHNKYLIDCGCVFGYTLGCLCLNNLERFYVKR